MRAIIIIIIVITIYSQRRFWSQIAIILLFCVPIIITHCDDVLYYSSAFI